MISRKEYQPQMENRYTIELIIGEVQKEYFKTQCTTMLYKRPRTMERRVEQ
jgi:hypothetical protein